MKVSQALTAMALSGAALGVGCAGNQMEEPPGSEPVGGDRRGPMVTASMLSDWPQASQEAAMAMQERYGEPDGRTDRMLVWHEAGPWKQIIVRRDTILHRFPMPHPDLLEQVIDYDVPVDMYDDLARYDGSVIVERTRGTMSARCDKEPMNFLALNLAHDVVTGAKSVEEARQFYAEQAMAFMNGQKHPYTQALQFSVPARAGDPDVPASGMGG